MVRPPIRNNHIDAATRLTGDIAHADSAMLERLRALSAEALRETPDREAASFLSRHLRLEAAKEIRDAVEASRLNGADLARRPVRVVRRDSREDLLEAKIAGPLTALAGAEELGPFVVDGGIVHFDFYHPARRFTVTESGAAAPAFVMTSARRPVVATPGQITLDLQEGTIWIRGDLLGAGLPPGAYAGITVSDGKVELPHTVTVGSDSVTVTAPLTANVTLELKSEEITPVEGACLSEASIKLPKLTFRFGPGGLNISSGPGSAEAWGQAFRFDNVHGPVECVAALWTVVLGCEFRPNTLDADAMKSGLADFSGRAKIKKAGLGLPVVVANPNILGPASVSPAWWLAVRKLRARWYEPDERFHEMDAWMAIGARGVTLFASSVAALAPSVTNVYRLWGIDGDADRRVPWRHSYDAPFLFFYKCDAITGEDLLATGLAKAALDRPVQITGAPVKTPTTFGVVHHHKFAGDVQASLAALVGDAPKNRFALRNALLWTTRAGALFAHGSLTKRTLVDQGSLYVFFGVFAWAPTLPDPYVGNFRLCRPDITHATRLVAAHTKWTDPADAVTSYVGHLGLPIVCDKPSSPIRPVPAPKTQWAIDAGLTQVEQDRRYPDAETLDAWQRAQKEEKRKRAKRVEQAERENARVQAAIDGHLREALGRTPGVLLLDMSTNQDLLGVALWGSVVREPQNPNEISTGSVATGAMSFPVQGLEVHSPVEMLRVVTLPQIQWEPVRTLDADQDILTLGWFPTPLASATDGGATVLGARSQKLAPAIPAAVLDGTFAAFESGTPVAFKTTLPFGLITVVQVEPKDTGSRKADRYELTRPEFPADNARGGLQVTAYAEGGVAEEGEISPFFQGRTHQLINGVDLASGAPLGLSVLSSTGDPMGDVETIFNNDMMANPKVPVTRFDLSGYGGSNFSKWENPFAVFAETSKTQFQVTVGRTALEIIKVASVLHPWGIKVTRSVIVERRSGGGVIRRDTGWKATTPGLFDYRYVDAVTKNIEVPDYAFDAGVFEGLYGVRSIRPAPGIEFSHPGGTFVPYYFDAELGVSGLPGRAPALGVLGWLQTKPNGQPATAEAIKALIEAQGAPGGPIDTWIDFGGSKLPFRAQRIEVDLEDDGGKPLFVATLRGVPKFPKTGAWSVVRRDLVGIPPGGGEAVPVSETRGVPIVRRYPVEYKKNDNTFYAKPPLKAGASPGPWRFADAADLLSPASPQNEYCILQSTPTHAFLFPRPYAQAAGPNRVLSDIKPELADIIARSTSKGAFPPPDNVIQLASTYHFDVGAGGTLALSAPVTVVNHPKPLRLSGSSGHGAEMLYESATLHVEIKADDWSAEFTGLRIWSDIAGMSRVSGAEMRIVGSTNQRPQVAQADTLVEKTIDDILTYLPIFGAREPLGPIDLGASNAKHEVKVEVGIEAEVPKNGWSIGGASFKLKLGTTQKTGFDLDTGGTKVSAKLTAGFVGEIPILSVGVASVYIIVQLDVNFSIASVSGTVTTEKFDLLAFVGIGIKGSVGPFEAYAFLGIGFVLSYDLVADKPKYGGLVRFEAGVSVAIVKVKLRADLQGLIGKDGDKTKCDYSGSVKLQVDIFLIISISATYTVSGTKSLE